MTPTLQGQLEEIYRDLRRINKSELEKELPKLITKLEMFRSHIQFALQHSLPELEECLTKDSTDSEKLLHNIQHRVNPTQGYIFYGEELRTLIKILESNIK